MDLAIIGTVTASAWIIVAFLVARWAWHFRDKVKRESALASRPKSHSV